MNWETTRYNLLGRYGSPILSCERAVGKKVINYTKYLTNRSTRVLAYHILQECIKTNRKIKISTQIHTGMVMKYLVITSNSGTLYRITFLYVSQATKYSPFGEKAQSVIAPKCFNSVFGLRLDPTKL